MKRNFAGGAHLTEKQLERRLRECAECGYVCKSMREYHPHAFCVLVKAGYNPWEVIRAATKKVRK